MGDLAQRFETLSAFSIRGLSVAITRSQAENTVICQRFWRGFNAELFTALRPNDAYWEKFAVTYNDAETLRYFCGVPAAGTVPEHFDTMDIPARKYLVFDHGGPISRLAETLSIIYRDLLPASGAEPVKAELFHFEKYDRRFHWSRADSIIEVWVPLR